LSVYLDASVLVALFTDDPHTARADAAIRAQTPVLVVSDFAAAEFASAIARRVRMGRIEADAARLAFSTFDGWAARIAERVEMKPEDVVAAEAYLRRLDLTLRAPDALNIAVAERVGAALMTFDVKMVASAQALGVALVDA
jgi:predicted nucleic acid-binding protein